MKRIIIFLAALIIGATLQVRLSAEDGVYLTVGTDRNISKINQFRYLPKSNQAISVAADKCVRLWDVNGWKKIDEFRFHIGKGQIGEIMSLAVSADESEFAIGRFGREGVCKGDIYIVQKSPRSILRLLRKHESSVDHVSFFDNDRKLLSVDESGLLLVWDLETGETTGSVSFQDSNELITCTELNKKGELALGSSAGNLYLLGLSPLKLIGKKKDGHPQKKIADIFWTTDQELISIGDDGNLNSWKFQNATFNKLNQQALGDLNNLSALTLDRNKSEFYAFFGADENIAEAGKTEISCRVFGFDLKQHRRLPQFDNPDRLVRHAQFIADRNELVVDLASSTIEVWDLAKGVLKDRFENQVKDKYRVIIDQSKPNSTTDLRILWREERNFKLGMELVPLTRGHDLVNRKPFIPGKNENVQKEDLLINSRSMAQQPDDRTMIALVDANMRPLATPFRVRDNRHGTKVFMTALNSPDTAVVGTDIGLFLFDPVSGKEIKALDQQLGNIQSISFSPDHHFLTTYSVQERSTAIWNIEKNPRNPELFAKLMTVGDEWALVSPDGFFDCTPAAEKFFGWHVNGTETEFATFHELDRFKDKYYAPAFFDFLWATRDVGLSTKTLGMIKGGIRENLGPRISVIAPQESTIKQKSPDEIKIKVGFEPEGNESPSAVSLLFNDRKNDQYYYEIESGEKEHVFVVKLAMGRQKISAKVYSSTKKANVSDRSLEIDFRPFGAQQIEADGVPTPSFGKLYYLGIGIDDFKHYSHLDFCRSDVEKIGEVFADGSKGAFYNEPELSTPKITSKEQFKQELEKLLQDENGKMEFKQTDTLVVMWSGHGDVDNQNNFYLVMPQCELPTQIHDESLRDNGISAFEIADELKRINGGNVILILDTCYAGKAVEQFRDSAGNLARRTNSDDYGIMVISATDATETSKENDVLGMSNFAFLLKTGLSGLTNYDVGKNRITAQASPLVELDGHRIVTTASLVEFLKKEMPGIDRTQTIGTNGFGDRIRFLARR